MSTKRILLVHDDRLLTNLYREKLEGSGFVVDSTRNLEQVPKLIESKKPDLLILDLVLPTGGGIELIKSLRHDPTTLQLPVLIFPTLLSQLGTVALKAGATKVIGRGEHPIASVIDAAKIALGLPGLGDSIDAPLFEPDQTWLNMALQSGPESLNQMRHCLPGLVASSPDVTMLRVLWTLVHGFAEKAALMHHKPLAQIAAAFDLLMCDLNEMPEQINASTLRTIGQAIDFLGTLSAPENMGRMKDPAASRIVVVDDEDSTLQFITAAMQLAGLKNECYQTPVAALEKLNAQTSDLIFLDVGLPEMSGFDLCCKIRALEAHKKTPIVFLTGLASFQNKAQASLSGGNDFVGKPFNLPELGVKALIWIFRGQLDTV
jgi:DNA-binding response OmpR family regulator